MDFNSADVGNISFFIHSSQACFSDVLFKLKNEINVSFSLHLSFAFVISIHVQQSKIDIRLNRKPFQGKA